MEPGAEPQDDNLLLDPDDYDLKAPEETYQESDRDLGSDAEEEYQASDRDLASDVEEEAEEEVLAAPELDSHEKARNRNRRGDDDDHPEGGLGGPSTQLTSNLGTLGTTSQTAPTETSGGQQQSTDNNGQQRKHVNTAPSLTEFIKPIPVTPIGKLVPTKYEVTSVELIEAMGMVRLRLLQRVTSEHPLTQGKPAPTSILHIRKEDLRDISQKDFIFLEETPSDNTNWAQAKKNQWQISKMQKAPQSQKSAHKEELVKPLDSQKTAPKVGGR
jgi:hypothetical protein